MVKGSIDFLGVNYYTARYAEESATTASNNTNLSYTTDMHVTFTGKLKYNQNFID